MPTIPSIRTSVENQRVLVLDEHAKNGVFRRDARGRLIAYTGGFSVVFPYETANGEKWAFRCWHVDANNYYASSTAKLRKVWEPAKKKAEKFVGYRKIVYLCSVKANVLTIRVSFPRGQAVNVTTHLKPHFFVRFFISENCSSSS